MNSLVLCVFGGPEFAAELAVAASKNKNLNVLVADMDTLNPSMDLLLNVKKECVKVKSYQDDIDNTSLNITLDALSKNVMTKELLYDCLQRKKHNLYVMTGNYNMDNYEYYNSNSITGLIEKIRRSFDLVILSASRWIYDDFTYNCMIYSDKVIIPLKGDVISFRNINSEMNFLSRQKRLDTRRVKFVVYEYDKDMDLSLGVINELAGGKLLGVVPYSRKRAGKRNKKAPYAIRMELFIIKEYVKILKSLDIPAFELHESIIYSVFKKLYRKIGIKKHLKGANKHAGS